MEALNCLYLLLLNLSIWHTFIKITLKKKNLWNNIIQNNKIHIKNSGKNEGSTLEI